MPLRRRVGGYRPAQPPDAAAAAEGRQLAAERASHRLAPEVNRLRAEGVVGQAALARALNEREVPVPPGRGAWTHTRLRPAVSPRRGELRFLPGSWLPTAGEELSPLAPRCVFLTSSAKQLPTPYGPLLSSTAWVDRNADCRGH